MKTRGHGLGWLVWRLCDRLPLIGPWLRWPAMWPIHHWWLGYWFWNGERWEKL
jgi:hypothetical protein